MIVNRNFKLEDIEVLQKTLKLQTKEEDIKTISYFYFDRGFWIEEIENFFGGKYTYNEIKSIIRGEYIAYYKKEKEEGGK